MAFLAWSDPVVFRLHSRLFPTIFWALQQIAFSWNDPMSSGPIVGCAILGPSCVALLLALLGSWQMVPTALSICRSLVKKWASTLAPRAHASKCTHVRHGWEHAQSIHITLDLVFFFESWCSYYEGSGGSVGYYLFTLLLGISYCPFTLFQMLLITTIYKNLNHQPPELNSSLCSFGFAKRERKRSLV